MTPVQTPADLRPLTALRFAAARWVAVYTFWPNLAGAPQTAVVAKGYLGVELFFVLSGFILSHVYLQAAGEKRFSYRGFLWARIARVYPLHLATLIGVGGLAAAALIAGMSVDANVLSWSSLPANLLMLHAWGLAPVAGWNHPSWSISAEWFAYLCFPLFAFVFWRLRDKPVAAVVGTAAFLTVLYFVFEQTAGFPLTEATIRWGALRIVPCFALGCALYLVYRKAGPQLSAPAAGAGAAIAFVLMMGSAALGLWDGITVLCAGVLILALAAVIVLVFVLSVYQLGTESWPALQKFGLNFFTSRVWNPVTGEFGVLPGHVPTVAQLKPGVLAVHVETDKNVKKARRRGPRTQHLALRLHTRPQTQRRPHGAPAGPQSLQP
jgi:peptidoglycan/LPS O-acetylase OafA/YrhL